MKGYPVHMLPFVVAVPAVAFVLSEAPDPLPRVISILALLAGYVWFSEVQND